jgi:enterochelin esterase-like enzyme
MRHQIVGISIFLAITLSLVGGGSLQAALPCDESAGRTIRDDYYAEAIQTRMYYTVYLPPCYDFTEDDYPVVYLLHGSNDDDNHWLRLGIKEALDAGITSGELPPMLVVLPFGNWVANENRFGDSSWGGVFIDDLMPLVEGQYRIRGQRDWRAIGGISRGGFWAFHIALRHPAFFSAVGGHSAFFDLHHAPPEHNPLDLAVTAIDVENLRIALDRGADDYAAPGLEIMHERLNERGLSHTYTVHPTGQHNNAYWSRHVNEYLRFYAESWAWLVSEEHDIGTTEPTVPPRSIFVTSTPRPTMTPVPTAEVEETGYYLLLPAVAFPSMQSSIEVERLEFIRSGGFDSELILADDVVAMLAQYGVNVNSETRVVPADTLFGQLWRDRRLYTLLPFERLMPRFRTLYIDEEHPLDGNLEDYAFAFSSESPNYHPDRLTRLLLSGVTALTRGTRTALDENGVEWAAGGITPYISRADFFHTSNEVSIYPTCPQTSGPTYGGSFSFCSKEEHFELFTLLGLDIVELSGNHNNDYGYDAYLDTLEWYSERGIAAVGGGRTLEEARRPLILNHNGNRVAMVACNWIGPYYALVNEDPSLLGGVRPGAAYCDLNWLRDALPQISAENDLLVITVQYLELDEYTPSDQQRSDFRLLAELGADVVIGTSSHYPQTFEFFPTARGETYIHYGMGNLFFDQHSLAGRRFFMNQLFIYEGRFLTVDLFTGLIEGLGRPRPMSPNERLNFLFLMFNEYGGF